MSSMGFSEIPSSSATSELDGLSSIKQIDLDDLGRISLDIRRPHNEDDMDEPELMAVAPPRSVLASAAESAKPSHIPLPPSSSSSSSSTSSSSTLTVDVSASLRRSGTYHSLSAAPVTASTTAGLDTGPGIGNGGYRELNLDDEEMEVMAPATMSMTFNNIMSTIKGNAGAVPLSDGFSGQQQQPNRIAMPSATMSSMGGGGGGEVEGGEKGTVVFEDEEGWVRFRRAVVNMQFLNAGNLCGAGSNGGCSIQ